jgi:uncharacterized protein (TIGR00369 family)
VLSVPARDELCQQRGFLHGGLSATLADTAGGYAAFSMMPAGSTPLTVEFKINFMAPAVGDVLIAEAHVLRSGRTLTVVDVDVSTPSENGCTSVGHMLGTYICLENTSDTALPRVQTPQHQVISRKSNNRRE